MSFIIMARDERNIVVRVGSDTFACHSTACDHIDAARENYPEYMYRSFHVELLKDKAYYHNGSEKGFCLGVDIPTADD